MSADIGRHPFVPFPPGTPARPGRCADCYLPRDHAIHAVQVSGRGWKAHRAHALASA
jgi:hypothetical protein